MPSGCLFCRIAAGDLPACLLYEDADTLAFMDIHPVIPGHALVIPRAHVDPIEAVPPELLARLMLGVQRVAGAQRRALRADGINVLQSNGRAAGQVVPHVHVHVIPRFLNDGHHWNWTVRPYAQPDDMRAMADRIKTEL